ncbi:MAG: type II toxin-antitoxin system VapC family toxin [Casimicrobiaceae bacterium]
MAKLIVAEPPAAYAQRPLLVVDASVVAAVIFAEKEQDQALGWMRGRALFAPQVVDLEITNVALNKLRRKSARVDTTAAALAKFAALDLERRPIAIDGVFVLAVQRNLSAYDAAYLWLAAELKAPLATFDARLGAAARSHLERLGKDT